MLPSIRKNTKKEKSLLSQVEDLNVKISVRSDLVKVNNQQANLLTQQININQRNITDLRKELQTLKKDYAEMIQKSNMGSEKIKAGCGRCGACSALSAFERIKSLSMKESLAC